MDQNNCPSASIYFYSLLCISFRLICFILAALTNIITTPRKLRKMFIFCCFLSMVSEVNHRQEDVNYVLGVSLIILVVSPHLLNRAIAHSVCARAHMYSAACRGLSHGCGKLSSSVFCISSFALVSRGWLLHFPREARAYLSPLWGAKLGTLSQAAWEENAHYCCKK